MAPSKFYRYETVEYAVLDMDGDFTRPNIPNPKLELIVYNLFKETPKGYWIGYGSPNGLLSGKRWVSKISKKRYAYPSEEEALTNFIKRTERRIEILSRQKMSCELSLYDAKQILKKQV